MAEQGRSRLAPERVRAFRRARWRRRLGKELHRQTGYQDPAYWQEAVEARWNEMLDEQRRQHRQQEAGSAEAAVLDQVQLLDASPATIRRPLCRLAGRAYAAAWLHAQRRTSQAVEKGVPVKYDPPRMTAEDVLLIVAGDGKAYSETAGLKETRPLGELGLQVRLPDAPTPGRGWSGAGVKHFLDGRRPDAVGVFRRVAAVVDRFLDFARSLTSQETMCELTSCYVLSTYFLDAFNVVGYRRLRTI